MKTWLYRPYGQDPGHYMQVMLLDTFENGDRLVMLPDGREITAKEIDILQTGDSDD